MTSRIPPLLEPYVRIPDYNDIVFLTSVLGASTNWLVLRFLYNALSSPSIEGQHDFNVVLVSFMRDFGFWKESARRVGIDLPRQAHRNRFSFIDGLSRLCLNDEGISGRDNKGDGSNIGPQKTLRSPQMDKAETEIKAELSRLTADGKRVLLVLDQPDLLLAVSGEENGATAMLEWILDLREAAHSTIITAAADYPLVQTSVTPLESNHAAFVTSLIHQAKYTMSLRLLDTGTAKDVSGVVRVTLGPADIAEEGKDMDSKAIEEKELLYFVGGDGAVNVFERGHQQ